MQHLPVSIAVVIKADSWAVAGAQRGVHDGSDLCAGQHLPASLVAAHWTLMEGGKTGGGGGGRSVWMGWGRDVEEACRAHLQTLWAYPVCTLF